MLSVYLRTWQLFSCNDKVQTLNSLSNHQPPPILWLSDCMQWTRMGKRERGKGKREKGKGKRKREKGKGKGKREKGKEEWEKRKGKGRVNTNVTPVHWADVMFATHAVINQVSRSRRMRWDWDNNLPYDLPSKTNNDEPENKISPSLFFHAEMQCTVYQIRRKYHRGF